MKAMLLAAGIGSRFQPHTFKLPKPALPFLNIPLGYYFFSYLKSVGVNSLVVNTFHLPEKVEELYSSQNYLPASFSHETGSILGSGGGLGNARKYFAGEENFFLLNADEVLIPHDAQFLAKMKEQHLRDKPIATLLVMRHHEVGSKFGGVWVDASGKVIGFGKVRPAQAVEGFHFPGIQLLNKKVFDYIKLKGEQNILYDNLMSAMQDGHRVEVFEVSGHWYETGNLQDYLSATKDVLTHLDRGTKEFSLLKNVLSTFAPHSALEKTNDALVWRDRSAKVSGSEFRDFAVLGKDSEVKNAKVEASVLGASTLIESMQISKEFILSK